MRSININLNIHYPYPIHTMKAYTSYVCDKCDCLSNTELSAKSIFSLPIYPGIKNSEVKNVIKNIRNIINKI